MENYKLTVVFSDGQSTVEKFRSEQGLESAIRWWREWQELPAEDGETLTIVSMEPEVLEPAGV